VRWRGAPGVAGHMPPVRGAGTAEHPPSGDEQARTIALQQQRIQQLERELESRARQAYQQGHNEGVAAGMQQAGARLDPVVAKLAQTLQELTGLKKKYLRSAEEDAVTLAVAVARRVLRRELTVDTESLLGVIKAAFEKVDARDIHRVRMNPEDLPVLQKHLAKLGMPPRVELDGDVSLERGALIVETTRGNLDASISTQLREIEQGLVDLVRKGP
jgi:flagellar assembly protein FliH